MAGCCWFSLLKPARLQVLCSVPRRWLELIGPAVCICRFTTLLSRNSTVPERRMLLTPRTYSGKQECLASRVTVLPRCRKKSTVGVIIRAGRSGEKSRSRCEVHPAARSSWDGNSRRSAPSHGSWLKTCLLRDGRTSRWAVPRWCRKRDLARGISHRLVQVRRKPYRFKSRFGHATQKCLQYCQAAAGRSNRSRSNCTETWCGG